MQPLNLPTYIQNSDQENYHAEFNQTTREWLSSDGWTLPLLTNANLTGPLSILNFQPVGTIWFNTDVGAPQVIVSAGVYKTFTIT